MPTSPPVPIPVAITPVAVPAVAVPVAVPVTIPFDVPVLSAIERQEQCELIGRTSLLEKRLIIIQQLIVINEGRLCSFDEAHPPCTPVRGGNSKIINNIILRFLFFEMWDS